MATAQSVSYVVGAGAVDARAMKAGATHTDADLAHRVIRRSGLWLVAGTAGRDTGVFLLDTGAPGLLLHRAPSPQAIATERLEGATGQVLATRFEVPSLEVANLRQTSVPAIGIDLTAARELLGEDLIGIIGYAQLADQRVQLDFRHRTIRFGESPPTTAEGRVYEFDFQAHLPTVRIGVGERAYDLAFDTGSEVNVFDDALLPELNESLRGRPSYKDVSGVDANVERAPYALVRLALLEDDHYSNRPFAFLDLDGLRQNLPALDGVLGVDFWGVDALVIDYPNRRITTVGADPSD